MARRNPRARFTTEALIVRRTPVGEADWMLLLFTPSHGLLSAAARSARRASSKLGVLEPLHGLEVELDLAPGEEVARLVQSKIQRPRLGILADGLRLDEAARILRWVRSTVGAGAPEPRGFAIVVEALDRLDAGLEPRSVVLRAGLELLGALGYGLELERCTGCGRPCPEEVTVLVDPAAGGIVCRACGGGPLRLGAGVRRELCTIADGGVSAYPGDVLELGARLVDEALSAHAARAEHRGPSGLGSRRR